MARALAVLGREAPLRHAARLARLDLDHAARACDALRAAGLVHGDAEVALAHPLIAAALYGSLAPGERALWHADAARMLSDERAGPERVALHLLRTDGNADGATVAALRAAAASATARGAPESAVGFLRRALAEPPLEPETAAAVRLELGLARAAHVQPDAPALLHDAVELAVSPAQRVAHALRGARALGLAGYFPEALHLCRRGLEDAASAPAEERERLEAELICNAAIQAGTVGESRELLRAAQERSGRLGLWRVNAAWQAVVDGRPATEVGALLAPALEEGDLRPRSRVAAADRGHLRAHRHRRPRRRDRALRHADRPRSPARLADRARARKLHACDGPDPGRPDPGCRDRCPPRLRVQASPQPRPRPAVGPAHARRRAHRGGPARRAEAALAAVDQLGDPPAGAFASPLLLQARARLRLSRHRHADAYADLEAAAQRWRELGTQHPGLASWRADAAEALCALGEEAEAGRLADEHLRLAERAGTPGPTAAGLRACARAAGGGERIELLERAAALTAGAQAQLEHTRALVDLGAALRRANRRADARPPLRSALDLAERHGMRLLARRARAELQAAGARPRRPALTGPDALTPTEHRVATLAAAGHSNRDIAQQLYVTRRTVETHLTHAFQKLDITNRDRLAACLADGAVREPALTG